MMALKATILLVCSLVGVQAQITDPDSKKKCNELIKNDNFNPTNCSMARDFLKCIILVESFHLRQISGRDLAQIQYKISTVLLSLKIFCFLNVGDIIEECRRLTTVASTDRPPTSTTRPSTSPYARISTTTRLPSPYPSRPTTTEEPITYAPNSTTTPEPITYAPNSTTTPEPITYAPNSTTNPEPITYAPSSKTTPEPITYAPISTTTPEPITDAASSKTTPEPITYAPNSTTTPEPVTYAPSSTTTPEPITYAPNSTTTPEPVTYAPNSTTTPEQITYAPNSTTTPEPITYAPSSTTTPEPITYAPSSTTTPEPVTYAPSSTTTPEPITYAPRSTTNGANTSPSTTAKPGYSGCLRNGCAGRSDGNYPKCSPDCQDGRYYSCVGGTQLYERDCPIAYYRSQSGGYRLEKLVYNPNNNTCDYSTPTCPRDLDNFLLIDRK